MRVAARSLRLILLLSLVILSFARTDEDGRAYAADNPVTISNYIDRSQAPAYFGLRSHWMQPWRSYLYTVPATTFLHAVGINFNVPGTQASATARLLGDSGFKRARVEVGWDSLAYGDPTTMAPNTHQTLVSWLTALRENGIRPLILLNSNGGGPCPIKQDTIELAAPAPKGATEVQINLSDLDKLVLGRTGITTNGVAAQSLFTSVNVNGTVHLSRPLSQAFPAGQLSVVTLRYEPFSRKTLEDGSPNPRFEATMQGWLNYVGVITREAKAILGSEEFDVEIWNELTFGSQFLDINNYYAPSLEPGENPIGTILRRTVDYLRDPADGVPNIGIGNGFANTVPWFGGSTSPAGLSAIDRHPYAGWISFPRRAQAGWGSLNGLGEPDAVEDAPGSATWHESFTPTYDAFFPEYYLSAIQAESLIWDVAPYETDIAGEEHGRYAHPESGQAPAAWITEVNLDPTRGPIPGYEMSAQDIRHVETKNTLRYLVAYINKGVTALDLFAANAGNYSLIDPGFFAALNVEPSAYPGDATGGQTMTAVKRLVDSMQGAEPIGSPRNLSLKELTDYSGHVQFEGNGTPQFPPLYNRDVFAFLPFQVTAHRFVIPLYIMTRNVETIYNSQDSAGDPTRFDMPPEPYRLALGGIDGLHAEVTATDPLSGEEVPVRVVSRSGDGIVIMIGVTDSPRLLTIQERDPLASPADSSTSSPSTSSPSTSSSSSSRARPLGLVLRVGSPATLLDRQHLPATAVCRQVCSVQFKGWVTVGHRHFSMRSRSRRAASNSHRSRSTAVLRLKTNSASAIRVALLRKRRVCATVTASAVNTVGARASIEHSLSVLNPRHHGSARRRSSTC